MRGFFLMSTKKKVIFVINMQTIITSNIRHLQIEKTITLLCKLLRFVQFGREVYGEYLWLRYGRAADVS